ncbi:3-oxoacyl-[acyl-carrier-protein] reductase FabG [Paenibacillus solanacearum]|uniref:3-oxoacyl-[acyl-carrier-protein] reductase FabG n=1 Tax=Paenibacillus solanacearum TaxID=2048548 RepID=A0A916K3C0_9BACL|nr:SDR family oxidoreductase [Paenibacillus solanacearum]CAG7637967.1 3-oxoacyl-[acyl-carrier-protein] reductase FabG [Paenibacillus solanacearum]
MNPMSQRIALVTGANRGIGKEIARQLARQGLHVLVGCRDAEKGRDVADQLLEEGGSAEAIAVEVNRPDSIARLMDNVTRRYGRLDVLVNNAGIILDRGTSVLQVERAVMQETFETNYFGALHLIQAVVPLMKRHHYGRIVNVSSALGSFQVHRGLLGLKGSSSAYRISKTMLNALTCLAAQEVEGWGIKVNAVCPGRVQTDMGGADAPQTVAEGADTAVWLATLAEDGPNGGFFRDRKKAEW